MCFLTWSTEVNDAPFSDAIADTFDVLIGPTVPVVAPTIAAVERGYDVHGMVRRSSTEK